ncbi:MAG TPA: type II 3-dehydroquinate dehydratase [Bacteroidales bacterium]|nr:3-dehydroquinate dehydratase [Bacteroidales bacterium]HOX78775.1 type II 3-dehydroquinate dehydratase [Bacteroidales bacterium]HPI86695.1 type II 3-dehydroquinate dehydratase [Bacteroidales bacterium]HPM91429.1 type II 3-dehydroquinate dehydratase [Bacteroidales bacterium]
MNLFIINGPNLNLLGKREPEIYGNQSFDEFLDILRAEFPGHSIGYYQSNTEGEIINAIQDAGFTTDGIIINPGGYSHTSVAIADAMKAVPARVIEVHISNVFQREDFRKVMVTATGADALICGFGLESYRIAIRNLTGDSL